MKKILCILLLSLIKLVSADNDGYLATAHNDIVHSSYSQCVHTTYFNRKTDGLVQCGEAIK